MLNKILLGVGISALAVTAASAEPLERASWMFGVRESVTHIDLSPDGDMVAYVAPGPGNMSVVNVAAVEGGVEKGIVTSSGDPERLSWCNFANDERLVCRINAIDDYDGVPVSFARLFALDVDGSDIGELGQQSSWYDTRLRQFDGAIIDWLSKDGDSILMTRVYVPEAREATRVLRRADGLGIDKVDINTLDVDVVEGADRDAADFISDGRGNVRIKEVQRSQNADGQMAAQTDYYYRRTGSADWEPFSSFNSLTRVGMIPVAIDADINSAYALKKLDGRFALYRVNLDGSMATELAYANPRVDVDNVVRIGRGQKVIGVTFAEDKRKVIYFDEEYRKLAEALSKAIPNLPLIQFAGASADASKLLIFAGSDSDPGRYYYYDKADRELAEIMLVRPQLEGVKLASVRPVSYPAPDGVSVPGYLTLPPGREAKGLPAVVLPHGGPSARDEWGFDWLAQFLANQGYAVLQPNYRGSDGYGDEWLKENGFKSWRTSIGDITAGANWLVSQGIADPDKLAILGWSYGGYAALQSAVVEPELYQAVVAIAPVTDLNLIKEEARNFTNFEIVSDYVGSGPHIEQGSPLQNVERITTPVLMFHGTDDINVGVRQSRLMDQKLTEAGKDSELIVFEGLEHSLVDSDARTQMLKKIGTFLAASMK